MFKEKLKREREIRLCCVNGCGDMLWHRIVKSLYGEEEGGWFTIFPRYTTKRSPWKDIIQPEEEFLHTVEIQVGREDRVSF